SGSTMLMRWRNQFVEMCDLFAASDPDMRLTWAGPDMGLKMFATARLMETWAHGWEIYDLLGVARKQTDRIRHIATIGAKTYGWTFANRKLEPPGPIPYLNLTAPSGQTWEWHAPQEDNQISGRAVEFCQVVTQVRNIEDTGLQVSGEPAKQWMAIAQCFAGPPEEPPAKGSRGPSCEQEE
ncbi:MAG: TIGR03084 family protein, partial [Gammaproteobacteria bacterium]